MSEFLAKINWFSPAAIGINISIGIIVIIVIVIAGYLWWAWSKKKWPFGQ